MILILTETTHLLYAGKLFADVTGRWNGQIYESMKDVLYEGMKDVLYEGKLVKY